MRAVIYARYSSDNQTEASIEGQLRECMEYATYNDIQVIGNYIDRAFSAKTDHRPEFQRMIKDSYKHAFDCIIVWKLDRFSRNRYDSAHYKALLRKNGVKVISAKETIAEGSEGILLESVLEGMAEYYSAELAEKVTRGMKENALKGLWNGGNVPFGYVINKERKLDIDPQAAPVVQEIFKLSNDGKTVKEIYNIMNERKVTRSNGKALRYNAIRYILSNRVYIGEYHHMGVVIENSVPPLVSEELFNAVQLELAKNSKAPARHSADEDYLLTTKLFCGRCGAMMVAQTGTSGTKGIVYRYYACVRQKKHQCEKKPVSKTKLEDFIVYKTMEFLKDDGIIERLSAKLYELQYTESTVLPKLQEQLKQKEKEIENIVNAVQKGYATETLLKRLDGLEKEKHEISDAIAKEQLKAPIFKQDHFRMALYNFRKIDITTQEGKRKIIDTFINSIYLYDDHLKIIYNANSKEETVSLAELESSTLFSRGAPKNGARLRPFTLRGRVCVLLLCGGARLRPFTLRGALAPFFLRRQIFFAQSRPKNFLAQIRPIFCGLRNNRNFCRLRNNRIFWRGKEPDRTSGSPFIDPLDERLLLFAAAAARPFPAAARFYFGRPIRSSGRTARTGGGNSIRRSKRRRSRACRSRCSNSNCSRSSHSNRYRRHSRCPGRHNRFPARSRFSDCRRPAFGSSILCGNRCDRYTDSAPLRQARRSRSSPACPATARRSTSFRRTGYNTVKT